MWSWAMGAHTEPLSSILGNGKSRWIWEKLLYCVENLRAAYFLVHVLAAEEAGCVCVCVLSPSLLFTVLPYCTASFGTLLWDRLLGLTVASTSWQMGVTSGWLQIFYKYLLPVWLMYQHRLGVKTAGIDHYFCLLRMAWFPLYMGKASHLYFFTSNYHCEP